MEKLQESSKKATVKFDQMLEKLLEKKLDCSTAIYRVSMK